MVSKDLRTGSVESWPPPGGGCGEGGGGARAVLRLVDGGLLCNNPADVALAEARLLHGAAAPTLLLSVGTGCPGAAEAAPPGGLLASTAPPWVWHLVNAAGDVAHADATVRALLGPGDLYCRLQPEGAAFGVALDDARPEAVEGLRAATRAFAAERRAVLRGLAAQLLPPGW